MPGLSSTPNPSPLLNKDWKLEPELHDVYSAWRVAPSPSNNRALLGQLDSSIRRMSRDIAGDADPITVSMARSLVLDKMPGYDPKRNKLSPYLYQQLQGLRRQSRQAREPVRAPERRLHDSQQLREHEQALADELGRDPTDQELSRRLGFTLKRIASAREYSSPMSTGQLDAIDPNLLDSIRVEHEPRAYWLDLVYEDLPNEEDRSIMEWTLGMRGRRKMSNQDIARKLGKSPGHVSQRKALIQALIDRESDFAEMLP